MMLLTVTFVVAYFNGNNIVMRILIVGTAFYREASGVGLLRLQR